MAAAVASLKPHPGRRWLTASAAADYDTGASLASAIPRPSPAISVCQTDPRGTRI
jgi:hypothetical protein